MSSNKKGFSDGFKMDVVSYAKTLSVNAAAGQFGVARSSIRAWINDAERRGLTIETLPLVAGNELMPASSIQRTNKRRTVRPKQHFSATGLQRRHCSVSDMMKAERAVLQGYQSLRKVAKLYKVPCSTLYSRICAKAKSRRKKNFNRKKDEGQHLETSGGTTVKIPSLSPKEKISNVEKAKIEGSTVVICVEKMSEDQIQQYCNTSSAINTASDDLNNDFSSPKEAKRSSIHAACKIFSCSSTRLVALFQYTKVHGYREAAKRYRIGINKIAQMFEKEAEIEEELITWNQTQHQSKLDESKDLSSRSVAMQRRIFKGKRLQVDKLLKKWFLRQIESGTRIRKSYISSKGLSIARSIGAAAFYPDAHWANRFLKRNGLTEKWQESLRKLRMVDTQQDKNVTSTNKEDIMSKAVAYAELYGNGMAAKKFNISEKSLCEWITKMAEPESSTESSTESESQEGKKRLVVSTNSLVNRVPVRFRKRRCPIKDSEIIEWIKAEKQKNGGRVPMMKSIRAKVREFAKRNKSYHFKASAGWLRCFKQRNFELFAQKKASIGPTSGDDEFVHEKNRGYAEVHSSPTTDNNSHSPTRTRTIEAGTDQDAEDMVSPRANRDENGYVTEIQQPVAQMTPIKTSPPSLCTISPLDGFPVGDRISEEENQTTAAEDYEAEASGLGHSNEERLVTKRGLGSCHSSNLEEQILFSETASYEPPAILLPPPQFKNYIDGSFPFGSTAKKLHFCLEQGCVFLNHGAFGATLMEALRYLHEWQIYMECQPSRFHDRVLFSQIIHVQKRLADFVGCKPSDLTLTSNVTTAINAVIQGLKLNEKSSICYLNVTCGAVKKVIKEVCFRTGAKLVEVEVLFPITELNDIVEMVRCTLTEGTTLAVFDHIPSDYAFVLPLKEIIAICHSRGVPVLIDGAHGLGQLPLNLSELGADYYAGNCHKWFCSPKGCGFLYVRKELQKSTSGLIISHGSDGGFHSQFLWTGVKDYCAYLSLHALFNFWDSVGADNIRKYCSTLLQQVIQYFHSLWQAELLAPAESHSMMCCISLPSRFFTGKARVTHADAEVIQNRLYSDFNIEVPIKCIQSKLYARISVHIHNQFEDYTEFVKAIIQIADKEEVSAC